MISILILSIVFCVYTAQIDSEHLLKDQYIDSHSSRAKQRLMFILCATMYSVWGGLMSLLILMVMFDQVLNVQMSRDFWYLGKTAKWDIFWRENITMYKIIKVLGLLAAITILIWQY